MWKGFVGGLFALLSVHVSMVFIRIASTLIPKRDGLTAVAGGAWPFPLLFHVPAFWIAVALVFGSAFYLVRLIAIPL